MVDPSDALYTSMSSSSPTPQHSTSQVDDRLGNRQEAIDTSRGTSPSVTMATTDQPSGGEAYYNVTHHDAESADDYYNSVSVLGSSGQPLIDPDDDQYVYIQNSDVPRPASSSAPPPGKPAVAAKPRHLSSPVAQLKKYINLGPGQRQLFQEKAVSVVHSEQAANQNTLSSVVDDERELSDTEDQPLYENFRGDDEDEAMDIYENVSR